MFLCNLFYNFLEIFSHFCIFWQAFISWENIHHSLVFWNQLFFNYKLLYILARKFKCVVVWFETTPFSVHKCALEFVFFFSVTVLSSRVISCCVQIAAKFLEISRTLHLTAMMTSIILEMTWMLSHKIPNEIYTFFDHFLPFKIL